MAKITLIGAINWFDGHLFDGLVLPDGIDKDVFIDTLVDRGGEFELLYSNLDYFKAKIPIWSKRWNRTFEKWNYALSLEYNPIENYDRIEEFTTNSNGKSNSNKLEKVSAFNSEVMKNNNQNENTEGFENVNTTTGRTHGNIGVTTSDQMLESHLKICRWNIYEQMADVFINEFMIPLYL